MPPKHQGVILDMPTFQQAMNGPEASEYINAMRLEIQTSMGQHTWETVSRPKGQACTERHMLGIQVETSA